ncbi:hypothetical protein ABW19_dt0202316 [Dactylella cylindrospora]|nr:hypothetical protein ABW19_dt0202316 [Dactylella cylindrospora]
MKLPAELVSHIASYLPGVEDLVHLSQSCKAFHRRICEDNYLWGQVFNQSWRRKQANYNRWENYRKLVEKAATEDPSRCASCLRHRQYQRLFYRGKFQRTLCLPCVERLYFGNFEPFTPLEPKICRLNYSRKETHFANEVTILEWDDIKRLLPGLSIPRRFIRRHDFPKGVRVCPDFTPIYYVSKRFVVEFIRAERDWYNYNASRRYILSTIWKRMGPGNDRFNDRFKDHVGKIVFDLSNTYQRHCRRFHILKTPQEFRKFIEDLYFKYWNDRHHMNTDEVCLAKEITKLAVDIRAGKEDAITEYPASIGVLLECVIGRNETGFPTHTRFQYSTSGWWFDKWLEEWFNNLYGEFFKESLPGLKVLCHFCKTKGMESDWCNLEKSYAKTQLAAHLFWDHPHQLERGERLTTFLPGPSALKLPKHRYASSC